jgi:hypothetical protein
MSGRRHESSSLQTELPPADAGAALAELRRASEAVGEDRSTEADEEGLSAAAVLIESIKSSIGQRRRVDWNLAGVPSSMSARAVRGSAPIPVPAFGR